MRAGTAFDARRRKLVPIVDATALEVSLPLMTSDATDCSSSSRHRPQGVIASGDL